MDTCPGAESHAVMLHLHGGAFVTGSPAAYRELAGRTSARLVPEAKDSISELGQFVQEHLSHRPKSKSDL